MLCKYGAFVSAKEKVTKAKEVLKSEYGTKKIGRYFDEIIG